MYYINYNKEQYVFTNTNSWWIEIKLMKYHMIDILQLIENTEYSSGLKD